MIDYSFNTTNREAPDYVVFSSILCPSVFLSTAGGHTNIEVFIEFQLPLEL
jgi:hypothetical protein